MADSENRCRTCGTALARDNTDGRCGPCQSADRTRPALPPVVPPEFWETEDMQAALRSRHMGKVIRAYRHHIHHGHGGLSQEDVARWVGSSQGKISRLETGPPPLRLDQLIAWATLLGIPQRHLWFKLPDDDGPLDPFPSSSAPPTSTSATDSSPGRSTSAEAALTSPPQGASGHSGSQDPEAATRSAAHSTRPDAGPTTARGAPNTPAVDDAETQSGEVDLTPTLPNPPIHIDISTAQSARMGDYLLGGGANFSVDREVTDYITEPLPGGTETARANVRASLAFQTRVARYLAAECGIRQFINLTARIPPRNVIHDVVHPIAPASRVVYAVSDDTAMAHAHLLKKHVSNDAVSYIRIPDRLDDTEEIVRLASKSLNFDKPVGLLVVGLLTFIQDDNDAQRAIAHLTDMVCSGSYIVLTHLTADFLGDEIAEAIGRLQEAIKDSKMVPVTLRPLAKIASFLQGLDLIEPGIVPIAEWRPDASADDTAPTEMPFMCAAVGRKP